MTEWFEQWFAEEYLSLYRHRDEEEGAQAVALIAAQVPLVDRCVLDLACGPGRHTLQLRAAGANVVGFDLSMPLLSRARHRAHALQPVVRGDMRHLPFRTGAFDVVVNLFTSFGYFSDDDQHRLVLREVATTLKKGGIFILDYFNTIDLVRGLVAHEEREIGTQRVVIERRISEDGRFVLKEMNLMDDGRRFIERVRLFTPNDLENLITEAGLSIRSWFGDYNGGPLNERSPRALLVSERQ